MKRKTFANSVLQTRGWMIGSAAVLLLLSAGGLMLLAQHAREQGNVVMVLLALHLASWSYVLGIVGLVLIPVLEFTAWFHAKRAAMSRYSSIELRHRDLEKPEMESPPLHLDRDSVVPSRLSRHSADRNKAKSSIKVA
ncbi:hypothetical protein [Nitrospira sp. Nam74]